MPQDVNRSKEATAQPTITAGAYSANDAVGGLLTFSDVGGPGGGGIIQTAVIIDDAKQSVETEIWLFNQSFTVTSDNAAFDPSAADMENLCAIIPVTHWYDAANRSAGVEPALGIAYRLDPTTQNLYGQLVTRGTPTYAATTNLTVKLVILQD